MDEETRYQRFAGRVLIVERGAESVQAKKGQKMKGPKLGVLIVAIVLAIGSFAFARHNYMSKHTLSIKVGGEKASATNPFADDNLFGDWVKDQWVLAIAVPVALIAGGAVYAFKK